MSLRTVARAVAGPKRERNEDAALVDSPGEWHLLAVADGIGGAPGGATASETAVGALREAVDDELASGSKPGDALRTGVDTAERRVRAIAADIDGGEDTGTTLVAAVVRPERAIVANVGDSRAYHHADGTLEQVTTDHTVAQELVEAGDLTPAAAKLHPERATLTRAIGPAAPQEGPDLFDVDLAGDLLLCSDGLPETLPEARIAEELAGASEATGAAEALLDRASMAGARDNLGVAIARPD